MGHVHRWYVQMGNGGEVRGVSDQTRMVCRHRRLRDELEEAQAVPLPVQAVRLLAHGLDRRA